MVLPLWRTVWNYLKKKKRKIELWYNPAITLLSIHPEKTSSKKIHTPVFIVALFTIAKTKKQPKCPLIDE